MIVHFAYKITLAVNEYEVCALYAVPVPAVFVFHGFVASSVYPVFANGFAGSVNEAPTFVPLYFIYAVPETFAGAVPLVEPLPLKLNVTVYEYDA